jgi:hypothetical protein
MRKSMFDGVFKFFDLIWGHDSGRRWPKVGSRWVKNSRKEWKWWDSCDRFLILSMDFQIAIQTPNFLFIFPKSSQKLPQNLVKNCFEISVGKRWILIGWFFIRIVQSGAAPPTYSNRSKRTNQKAIKRISSWFFFSSGSNGDQIPANIFQQASMDPICCHITQIQF